jgi:hypothetical protein
LTTARCAHAPARRNIAHAIGGAVGIALFSRVTERARSARWEPGATDGRAASVNSGSAPPPTQSPWLDAPAPELDSQERGVSRATCFLTRLDCESTTAHSARARRGKASTVPCGRAVASGPLLRGKPELTPTPQPPSERVHRNAAPEANQDGTNQCRVVGSAESSPVRREAFARLLLTSLHPSGMYRHQPCAQCAVCSRAVLLAKGWCRGSGTFSTNCDGAVGPCGTERGLRLAARRLVSRAERRNGRGRRRGAPQTGGRSPILRRRDRHDAPQHMDGGAARVGRPVCGLPELRGTRDRESVVGQNAMQRVPRLV